MSPEASECWYLGCGRQFSLVGEESLAELLIWGSLAHICPLRQCLRDGVCEGPGWAARESA